MKSLGVLGLCLAALPAYCETPRISQIVVDRSARTMTVQFQDGKKESYRVSLGRAGTNCTRTRTRDNCTPTGNFFIAAKHPSQRFHRFLLLSYPDEKSAERGLQTKLISQSEFENINAALKAGRAPPQNTTLGGNIGIHGQPVWVPGFLGRTLTRLDWTAACVSVTDAEIDHIYDLSDVGTPVTIK